tara:strand:+ start:2016 stop:2786 length:771 start_codon:yes stop_codon:yes gene_type:complete
MIYKKKDLFDLKNKIVLLTGVSGQLGTSFAKLYLSYGCKVYGVDVKKCNLNHENFYFYKKNLATNKNVKQVINSIVKKHKKIDIIVNNAAVSFFSNILKRSKKELDSTLDVNLKSVIYLITEYFRLHKKMSLKKCKIINIASIYGMNSPDFKIYGTNDRFSSEIYGASKAGVIQLTKYFSVLFAKYNITINSISPGGIKNQKTQNTRFQKKYSKLVPLNRMADVEDIFTAMIFLSSDNTKYITGQNITIDGGMSAK